MYAVIWLRVQPLLATRQQLLLEIQAQTKQRDELQKEVASLKEQRDSLNESVTALAGKIGALQGTGKQVQELKSEAVHAWEKFPPKQAWCYQERDFKKPAESQYSVHCHWSEERCSKAKAASKTASPCAFVPNLDTADWKPSSKGWMDSWYQLDRPKPLPAPFPQDLTSQGTEVTAVVKKTPAIESEHRTTTINKTNRSETRRFKVIGQIEAILPDGGKNELGLSGKKLPDFPEEELKQGVGGTVHLKIVIDKDGRVRDVKAVTGIEDFKNAAEAAIKQWQFKPFVSRGEPIEVQAEVEISFKVQ
ncbi:MAG TPA: TonB family protein [Candidatus Dormibacteraeota bacterium]|nr:TonB family protein [Candidatus Dormibacteraeota bacterium]